MLSALSRLFTPSAPNPLPDIIKQNNVDAFKAFISAHPGYNLNLRINGFTPATMAVMSNATDILRILIDAKTPKGKPVVDLNKASGLNKNLTPLLSSIAMENMDTFQLLIDAKDSAGHFRVNLNRYPHNNDLSPIQIAIAREHDTILSLLINAYDNENKPRVDLNDGATLALVMHTGNIEYLRLLLAARTANGDPRIDINAAYKGMIVIYRVISSNRVDILKELLALKNADGTLAFDLKKQLACLLPEIVTTPYLISRILLEFYSESSMTHYDVLHFLASFKTETGEVILDFHAENNNHLTPALMFVCNDDFKQLQILAQILGSAINTANSLGLTPLEVARAMKDAKKIQFLEDCLAHSSSNELPQAAASSPSLPTQSSSILFPSSSSATPTVVDDNPENNELSSTFETERAFNL